MAALEINAQEPVVKTKYELTGRSLGNGLQDLVVSARGGFGGQKLEAGMNNLVGSAKENYTDFKNLAHDAVSSKAYLYPFKGILYFIIHPNLWRLLWPLLGPAIITAAVTISMFFFTYWPQVFIFGIFHGPFALVNVFFLVLSESAVISGAITKSMFLGGGLVDSFDAASTLIPKGSTELVAQGGEIKTVGDIFSKIKHKAIAPAPKSKLSNVLSYFMLFPLNFIPIVGTGIFLYLHGKRYGTPMHQRYFQLKDTSSSDKGTYVASLRGTYTAFSNPASFLEHLTGSFGIFFAFTNTIGAALWAHDMENNRRPDQEEQDFDSKCDELREQLEARIRQNPGFQDEAKSLADKHGPLEHSTTDDTGKDLQAQIDQVTVGRVAQSLHAQTAALAAGVLKGFPKSG